MLRVLAAASLALLATGTCGAAEDKIQVGYEYATWLGSGAYQVGGRNLFILRLPFYKELREPSGDRPGVRVLLPLSVGWLDTGGVISTDLQTLTLIPGLELDYRLRPNWHLKPYIEAGIGKDLSGGDLAYIGAAGIRSRFELERGDYRFSIGNELVMAGSWLKGGGDRSAFTRFDAGIAVSHPLDWSLAGRRTSLEAFYVASFFSNGALVVTPDFGNMAIGTINTLGLALSLDRPVKAMGLELGWLGLSYVFGNGFNGVRFNAGFPF